MVPSLTCDRPRYARRTDNWDQRRVFLRYETSKEMVFKGSYEEPFWLPEEEKKRTRFDNKVRINRTTGEMTSAEIKNAPQKGLGTKRKRKAEPIGTRQGEFNRY